MVRIPLDADGGQVRAGRAEMSFGGTRLRTADDQTGEGLTDGETLTGASFAWVPGVRYARVMVTDGAGRRAWSNPIWAE